MIKVVRRLPPFAAVRVFEAAARHENFTAAANELAMTQAAVSYQIKLLEARLGTLLFRREKKRVLLTDGGSRLSAQLTRAFDAMDAGFTQLRQEQDGTLTISTTTTFASTWLAWRIGAYQLGHPEIAVRLTVDNRLVDFSAEEIDVAIRSGTGDWPGVLTDALFKIDFTPMCSPAFLAEQGPTVQPADILRMPLIGPDDSWWEIWLREAGVNVPPGHRRAGVRLDSQASEGNAAMAGQGMAMLTPLLWRNDLAEGRLVRPFEQTSSRGYGYWLVIPEHRRSVAKIGQFRDWLLSEIARESR